MKTAEVLILSIRWPTHGCITIVNQQKRKDDGRFFSKKKMLVIIWVGPPPSNSGKWRFRVGSPTKNITTLVVTVTGSNNPEMGIPKKRCANGWCWWSWIQETTLPYLPSNYLQSFHMLCFSWAFLDSFWSQQLQTLMKMTPKTLNKRTRHQLTGTKNPCPGRGKKQKHNYAVRLKSIFNTPEN